MKLLEKLRRLWRFVSLHTHETVAMNKWRQIKQPRYGHANFDLHPFIYLFPKQFPVFGSHSHPLNQTDKHPSVYAAHSFFFLFSTVHPFPLSFPPLFRL